MFSNCFNCPKWRGFFCKIGKLMTFLLISPSKSTTTLGVKRNVSPLKPKHFKLLSLTNFGVVKIFYTKKIKLVFH